MIADILFAAVVWVGHACIWTTLLNVFYSQYWPKQFLKPWRIFSGIVILGYAGWLAHAVVWEPGELGGVYNIACFILGITLFPAITIYRNLRPRPTCILAERTVVHDLGRELGPAVRGNGKWRWLTFLPWNGVFRFDVTELTLELPRLPAELHGLSILFLSDPHFHGTPSKLWFEAIVEKLLVLPKPDIIALGGDYVDTDEHRNWIAEILGRLEWNGVGIAILGNHDAYHGPDLVRGELAKLGFRVIGDRGIDVDIRGQRCVFAGYESPWFPRPAEPPTGGFRIGISHSPDGFRWAESHQFDLVLAGHVHGGAIRLPIIGPIFVPSRYGRRYDTGVYERNGTVMVVGRGLSGKEPIRFRCNPQVIRITLAGKMERHSSI